MKRIFFFLFLGVFSLSKAQVKGVVKDSNGSPLSFVSIYLDKTVNGTTSNENGVYELPVKSIGKYTIIYQTLGYKTVKKNINIKELPFFLDVVLEEESVLLNEISIASKENPANEIIRNAIANKEKNTDKYANFTAKFYSRGLTRIEEAPESFLGQSTGDFGGGLDSLRSGIIYLSETFSNISFQKKPKRFKEKIIASKVSGEDNGVSFNRAEDSNINLYENSIAVFNDLISPISTNAFGYYTFALEGSFYDANSRLINKVKVIPKRENDRVFKGYIYIVEDDWAIYGCDLSTSGLQVNLPFVNALGLKQGYAYSETVNAWVLISQSIAFDISIFGFKPKGKFSYVYSDYDFSPNFTETTFSNEVLTFEENATQKDTVFWNRLRPVALTKEEINDYKIKDSIKVVRKSKKYLDSLDVKNNKFKWTNTLLGYTYNNSYKNKSFSFSGPLLNVSFNTVQGLTTSMRFNYFEQLNNKGKWWNASTTLNYGFSEQKLRPVISLSKKWNNLSKPRLTISGGITTAQFNGRNPIKPLDNLIRTLTRRLNYMKIYEKEFVKIDYNEEIFNGVYFSSSLEYTNRKPLFNTTNYSFARQSRNPPYTSNNPLEPQNFTSSVFTAHKIAILNLGTTFVFGQKYLSYPNRKVNVGGRDFPVIRLNYRKTFGAENKAFNSALITASVTQDINAGNYGKFFYYIRGGAFLQQKDIAFMDNLQVKGNQMFIVTDSNRKNNFGLLEYYRFFTNDKYAEAHVTHNFKGAILAKIPVLNTLNYHLITSAKTMYMANTKQYSELSVGMDNIGFGKWRFLRVDYIKSFHDGVQNDGFLLGMHLSF